MNEFIYATYIVIY